MATTHGDMTRRKPGTVGAKLPTRGQVEEEGGVLEKGAAQELTSLARVFSNTLAGVRVETYQSRAAVT